METSCRHFADNWVVAWGPGFRSDLAVEWESFKAARSALSGVVTPGRARDQAATYAAALPGLQAQLTSFLLEGKLKVRHTHHCSNEQLPQPRYPHAASAVV